MDGISEMGSIKLPKRENCTGCEACYSVCPVNAINMNYNEYYFSFPVIDTDKCINCGLCTKTCPILNPKYKNNSTPAFYSFCADDQTRVGCSSGGMFPVLADYVFERSGYVCGAAFNENFQLKHRIVDNRDKLEPLRYSKYVQSDVNDCYNEVKKLLEKDNYVLFVGTPCQVAGVYGVLKKDYEKLITVDLICKGVPPQKFLDSYLKEVSNGRKIKNIYFRNKRFGWSCSVIYIEFEDSTEYVRRSKGENMDPYFAAFQRGYSTRDTCFDCKFRVYPRQGDFSIGDLWSADTLDPKSDDKKGTSLIFANNEKAETIFDKVIKSEKVKYYNRIFVEDYTRIPNNVVPKKNCNPLRSRFLDLTKTHSFADSFKSVNEERYDIGLVSIIDSENIGSVLTYYALFNTLQDMNYSVLVIERPMSSRRKISDKAKNFTDKWLPNYAGPVQKKDLHAMAELNKNCDQFVIGADQIFLQESLEQWDYHFFLDWVNDNKNKVGYACSFGGPGGRGSKEYYRFLSYFLNRFSSLSIREDDGVNFANNTLRLSKEVKWSIDPVFLCDKEHFMKLVRSVQVNRKEEFIGAYVLKPKTVINELIKKVKAHFGELNVELIGKESAILKTKEMIKHDHRDVFPIENSLETIFNCKFFVTDSFHGVCFSIIFRKDFLVIPRDFSDRFTSLLSRLGLEDRIIESNHSNLSEKSFGHIDYDKVYEKLLPLVEDSKKLLASALKGMSDDKLSDRDVLMKYIEQQHEEIEKIKTQINEYSKRE